MGRDNYRRSYTRDVALEMVFPILQKKIGNPPEAFFGSEILAAVNELLDEDGTQRQHIEELDKLEKIFIGYVLEKRLRRALNLGPKVKLDYEIAGFAVDLKWSKSCKWEIPREAVGELCFLVGVEERGRGTNRRFLMSAGLVRCNEELLCAGSNQDKKRNLSAEAKQQIKWLMQATPLPPELLQRFKNSSVSQ